MFYIKQCSRTGDGSKLWFYSSINFMKEKNSYLNNKSFQIITIIIIIIITARTVPNSRPQSSTLSRCSNSQQSHNPHGSVTKNLQKYTDLKAELISMWQLNAVYTVPFDICYPQTVLSHINCTTD